jgi:hypothetical protein
LAIGSNTPSGELVKTPGAVSATRGEDNLYEVLVCNNYVDTITRHVMDSNGGLQTSEVFLKNGSLFLMVSVSTGTG